MAWLYSGFRTIDADGTRSGWHDSPISYGAVARISIDISARPALHAASVQLDPLGAAVWLSELPADTDVVSDSIAWFARVAELARRMVSAGRMSPIVVDEGPFTVARWAPEIDDEIGALLATLDAAKPDICTAGSGHDTRKIFELMVDGVAPGPTCSRTDGKPTSGAAVTARRRHCALSSARWRNPITSFVAEPPSLTSH